MRVLSIVLIGATLTMATTVAGHADTKKPTPPKFSFEHYYDKSSPVLAKRSGNQKTPGVAPVGLLDASGGGLSVNGPAGMGSVGTGASAPTAQPSFR